MPDQGTKAFGDPEFWYRITHDGTRANDLVLCYPEGWLQRDCPGTYRNCTPREALRLADACLSVLCRPSRCLLLERIFREKGIPNHPRGRYKPSRLRKTDPIYWVAQGFDRYEAGQLAKREYEEKVQQAGQYTPIDPDFWVCVGLPKRRAEDIAKCFAEYWVRSGERWSQATKLAETCLKALTGQLRLSQGDDQLAVAKLNTVGMRKYAGYHLSGRTPIHCKGFARRRYSLREVRLLRDFDPLLIMYLDRHPNVDVSWRPPDRQELTWEAAVRQAAINAGIRVPGDWQERWQKQRPLEGLGPQAAFLPDDSIFVAGARLQEQHVLLHQHRSRIEARKAAGEDCPVLQWGPVPLDSPVDRMGNCCVLGVPRAGKTVVLRLMIQSSEGMRLVVYDDKTDFLSILRAIRPDDDFHILNPFDLRGSAWHIAADALVGEPRELARVLLEDDPLEKAYFKDAPLDISGAVIQALNQAAPGQWEFADFLGAHQVQFLQPVLCRFDSTRDVYASHLGRLHDSPSDLPSCLGALLNRFKPIAAAWMHATRQFSVRDWIRLPHSAVLGNHDRHRAGIRSINRALIQLMGEAKLDPATNSGPPTRFVFDEAEQLGNVELLPTLLNRGPGMGASVALGFHDIESLERYYGQGTRGLVGMCVIYAFLRISNPATARWASEVMGTQEVIVVQKSEGKVGDQSTTHDARVRLERPLVRPSELQELPLTTSENGLTGYFKTTGTGTYLGTISGTALFDEMLKPAASDFPNFVPRPPEHFVFPSPPEIAARLAKLGFATLPNANPPQQPPPDNPRRPEKFDPRDFPRLEP